RNVTVLRGALGLAKREPHEMPIAAEESTLVHAGEYQYFRCKTVLQGGDAALACPRARAWLGGDHSRASAGRRCRPAVRAGAGARAVPGLRGARAQAP